MKSRITVTGVNRLFLAFALIFILWQLVLAVVNSALGGNILENRIYEILLVNQFLIILLPVLVYTVKNRLDFKETFRINKLDFKAAVLIVAIALFANIAASMLNSVVVFLLQFLGEIPRQPLPVPQNPTELLTGLLMLALIPAVCEEMLHRGLFLSAYESRGSMKAVGISAIFFGFFHFDISNLLGPIFLGVLIGYYVIRTNSIFAGVLAHFMNNAISEFFQYLSRNEAVKPDAAISVEALKSIVFIGLISMLIIWMLIRVFNSVTEGKYVLKPPISGVREDIASILSHWPVIIVFVIYLFLTFLFLIPLILTKVKGISY